MKTVDAAAPFEVSYAYGTTGAAGTIEVAIIDGDNNVVFGPTTDDIVEQEIGGTGTGIYVWNAAAAPSVLGQYFVVFSPDGTWDADTTSTPEEILVVAAGGAGGDSIPVPADAGPAFGPAQAWTTAEAVADCCELEGTTDPEAFDPFISSASQLLFTLSGRQFYGLSLKTGMRPPCRPGCGCGGQVLSRGHIVPPRSSLSGWWGLCSGPCEPDRVLLSGYPVNEVTQVKIDGVIVDPAEYRLERNRWLVRLGGEAWPRHNDFGLADTEEGTWSVSYTFGQAPPLPGQDAATELACDLYKNCTGGECVTPRNAVRKTRAGVTIEMSALRRDPKTGAWQTGLRAVDHFLNAYNPAGMVRRPKVQSPASHLRYAKRVA